MACFGAGTPCSGPNQCCYPNVCVSGGNKIGAPIRPQVADAGVGPQCGCVPSGFGPCFAGVECCNGNCNGGMCQ